MSPKLIVHILPFSNDNYCYLLRAENSTNCLAIDPGASDVVIDFLNQNNFKLKQIWITHFHSDHVGGNQVLKDITSCEIVGPKLEQDKIPAIDRAVSDLDILEFSSRKAKVLETPGHTLGHVVYWFYEDNLLFSGDTLFCLGCGCLFEGNPMQMWQSLCKIRNLPPSTKIYGGHEYSLSNAKFALSIDHENSALRQFYHEIDEKRSQNRPTYPTELQKEILSNPFLRADLPYWKSLFNQTKANPGEVFSIMREKKNHFK